MENKPLNAEPLLVLIWKNRKLFIVAGILAAIVSSVASFMIPVKYKAACTMFPSKTHSLSMVERGIPAHGVELFGEEEEGERMLAILNSSALMNTMIDKYKLFKHYNIDLKSDTKNDQMAGAIREHIQFERTRYGSVNIIVWDQNPDTAALIANDLGRTFDKVMNSMISEGQTQNYISLEREYQSLLEQVKEVQDTMRFFENLGVVSDEEPWAALIERETEAMMRGGKLLQDIQPVMEANRKYRSIYRSFFTKEPFLQKRVEALKSNLDQLQSDARSTMAHKYIADYASPPDKKAYPVRWLVVVVSTVSAIFLLLTLLVILQKIRQLKAQV
jgi:capsular polysaccharide biosynthesis protein